MCWLRAMGAEVHHQRGHSWTEGQSCIHGCTFWAIFKAHLLSEPQSRPPFSKYLLQGLLGAPQVPCCLWLPITMNWTKTLIVG